MNAKAKNWTYDVDHEDVVCAGQYIASIGKQGVVSVWLIVKARRVQHRVAKDTQGWALQVVPAPEAKAGAEYDAETNQLWVRGEPAHPFFWHPRNAK